MSPEYTCKECDDVLDYQLDYEDWFQYLNLGKGFRCNNVYSERYPGRVKLTDKMCIRKQIDIQFEEEVES